MLVKVDINKENTSEIFRSNLFLLNYDAVSSKISFFDWDTGQDINFIGLMYQDYTASRDSGLKIYECIAWSVPLSV